jgi:hypothetical protein
MFNQGGSMTLVWHGRKFYCFPFKYRLIANVKEEMVFYFSGFGGRCDWAIFDWTM